MATPLLGMFPTGFVDQLEAPRWILILVCLTGVLLACATDEGNCLLAGGPDFAEAFSSKSVKLKTSLKSSTPLQGKYQDVFQNGIVKYFKTSFNMLQVLGDTITSATLESPLYRWIALQWRRLQLYREIRVLQKISKSSRHFSYLLQKKAMNEPIDPSESEMDSYLSVKHRLAEKWPFMWEVSNVRSQKIECNGQSVVPMSSYSYLDLIRDDRVQEAAIRAAREWSTGNHGPRMLGGNMRILRDLEGVISRFFSRDDTLLCATGYLACMSACAAISSERTVIFADSRLHASLQAGLKIGNGHVVRFKHNCFDDCEAKIRKINRHKYVDAWMVIESVYSMDGDIGNLPAAVKLCEKYNIKLMVDEAHGLGVLGKTGRGVEEHFNLRGKAALVVGTFSKSIASIGGYICGSAKFISYLDFHAPGNVFSAPLPAYSAGAALESFRLIDAEPNLVFRAQENSLHLRKLLESGAGYWPLDYPEDMKYRVEGHEASTVIPVIFPDDLDRVLRVANGLKMRGYMVSAVAYPACPMRTPRFRITATSGYTMELMDSFVRTLIEVCVSEPPSELVSRLKS